MSSRTLIAAALVALLAAACAWLDGRLQADPELAARTGVALERAFPRLRFDRPVFLTGAGDGSGRLFVCEQAGVVRVFDQVDDPAGSAVFLDIRERVSRAGNEEGLLGLAFAPDFADSGRVYVHYSSSVQDQTGVVARFTLDPADPSRLDPASEEPILVQPQPWRNHNGGALAFGPDGMLYISFGDGGAANDPKGSGQDRSTWLGAVLRIDVSGDGPGYRVPDDNPFVGQEGVAPELWAYGLRNVWRMAFDRETGALWAGDIGQNRFEEVDRLVAGGNYGWNTFEASHDFEKGGPLVGGPHIPPEAEYGRGEGLSITGGSVYRGKLQPALRGRYLYGDYATGNLWALDVDGGGPAELVCRTGRSIASFGEDDDGELFLASFDGGIYRIVAVEPGPAPLDDWPRQLSETGLFVSTADHEPAAHLLAYQVNAPFWSDGADKQRFVALPEGGRLGYRAQGTWDVPVGATLVKSFRARDRGEPRLLETRLITRTPDGWEAATYLWSRDGQDAVLAPEGRQFELWNKATGVTSWHAPSASECGACHVADAGYALGLTTAQLSAGPGAGEDPVQAWIAAGLVDGAETYDRAAVVPLVALTDEAPLHDRARSWLDVNCAPCHRPDGPGNAAIDLRRGTALADTGLVDVPPAQGDLGLADARLVAPGDPDRSILWRRVHTLGDGRMPNLASNRIDDQGSALLREWITSLR